MILLTEKEQLFHQAFTFTFDMEGELITLLSLDDARRASQIKEKLEQKGIACFMGKGWRKNAAKLKSPVDLRVNIKDLDEALKLISDDGEPQQNDSVD